MIDMECPNGWQGCDDCNNKDRCIAGMFTPEEDRAPIIKAAEIAEASTQAEAVEGAKILKGETLRLNDTTGFWKEWGKYSTPDLHAKEPMPAGQGAPGGGNKSRAPKKPQKKTPEYMKILGM